MSDNYRRNTVLIAAVCLVATIVIPSPLTFILGAGVTAVYYFAEKRRLG
jgi:hypothetical protein